jgi:hypothetical protein
VIAGGKDRRMSIGSLAFKPNVAEKFTVVPLRRDGRVLSINRIQPAAYY